MRLRMASSTIISAKITNSLLLASNTITRYLAHFNILGDFILWQLGPQPALPPQERGQE